MSDIRDYLSSNRTQQVRSIVQNWREIHEDISPGMEGDLGLAMTQFYNEVADLDHFSREMKWFPKLFLVLARRDGRFIVPMLIDLCWFQSQESEAFSVKESDHALNTVIARLLFRSVVPLGLVVLVAGYFGYQRYRFETSAFRDFGDQTVISEDFSSRSLKSPIFTGTTLQGSFAEATMPGADFSAVTATGLNFRDAHLREATFNGAYLEDANFSGADLRDADLRNADLRGAILRGTDLRGAQLQGANLTKAQLVDAKLGGANLTSSSFAQADLQSATLDGAVLTSASLQQANLRSASLRDVDLGQTDITGADFTSADLSGVVLMADRFCGAETFQDAIFTELSSDVYAACPALVPHLVDPSATEVVPTEAETDKEESAGTEAGGVTERTPVESEDLFAD